MSKSVGKIVLDLEIQSDIKGQINMVASQIGKGLKNSLQNASKQGLSGIKTSMAAVIGNMKQNFSAMGASLKAVLKKAMSQFTKVKQLFSKQKNSKTPKEKGGSATQKRGPPKNQSNIKSMAVNIPKTIIGALSKLPGMAFGVLGKFVNIVKKVLGGLAGFIGRALKPVAGLVGRAFNGLFSIVKGPLKKVSGIIGPAFKKGMNAAKPVLQGTTKLAKTAFSKLAGTVGNILGSIPGKMKGAFSTVKGFIGGLGKGMAKMGTVLKVVGGGFGALGKKLLGLVNFKAVFDILKKGFDKMKDSLFEAISSNSQFQGSLKQINSNLTVAVTPIYQAVIPAINALMSVIVKITGYIAAFTSSLFGKTLQGSVDATKGLGKAKDAMEEYGASAEDAGKSAQNSFGIDELNIVQADNDSKSGGGGDAPEIMTPDIGDAGLIAFTDKVQTLLSGIFTPLKNAWDSQGANVVASAQSAFRSLVDLGAAIGKSFMDVWTNGTGQEFCENILILVADIFKWVDGIANAWQGAWENKGDAYVQSIFDKLNAIMKLVHEISESFRNAWNSGSGQEMLEHILQILTDANQIITYIADNFRNAWMNSGGDVIAQLLLDILNIILGTIEKITSSTKDWAKNLDFGPIVESVKNLLEKTKPLIETIGEALAWIWENVALPLGKWIMESAIPKVIDAIAEAFGLLNNVLQVLKPLFLWIWDHALKPLASWTGGTIVEIINGIISVFKGIGEVFKKISDGEDWGSIGKYVWEGLINGLTGALKWVWEKIKDIFNGIVDFVKDIFGIHSPSTVFEKIGGFLIEGLKQGISKLIGGAVELFSGFWGNVEKVFGGVKDFFKEKFGGAREKVSGAFSNVGEWFGEKFGNIKTSMQEAPKFFGEKFSTAYANTQAAFGSVGGWFGEKFTDVKNAFQESPTWFQDTFGTAYANIQDSVEPIGGWFGEKYENVQTAFQESPTWFQDTFGNAYENIQGAIEPIGGFFGEKYGNIQDAIKEAPDWLKTTFTNAYDNITSVFDPIKEFFNGVGNTLETAFKNGINGAIGLMNRFISFINEKMNFSWDSLEIAGKEIIPSGSFQLLKIPPIPALAQGGYVGANTPQLAMIGDNRHQGEVVAPEDKLRKMAMEAVQLAGKENHGDTQYLIQMIALLKDIISLVKNFDMVVNIDVRDLHRKLGDLEKRMGYSFT